MHFSRSQVRIIYRTLKTVKNQAELIAKKTEFNVGLKEDILEYKILMNKIEDEFEV